MRDLAPIVLTIIAFSSATLGVVRYSEGSRPVSDFLDRAQIQAETRGVEELLETLGAKPAAAHVVTQIAHVDEPPVASKLAVASAPTLAPELKTVASPPKPTVKPQVEVVRSPSGAKKTHGRKTRVIAGRSADDWVRKGSSYLRLVRNRF